MTSHADRLGAGGGSSWADGESWGDAEAGQLVRQAAGPRTQA